MENGIYKEIVLGFTLRNKIIKMEINLKTDERIKLIIDKTCEFEVWGERNDEGTMVIKHGI